MAALERLDHKSLVQLATRSRKQARNAEMAWARVGSRATAVIVGGGSAWAAGAFMENARVSGEADGTLGTTEDPSKVGGVDIDLVAGLILTIGGVVASGKPKFAKYGQYIEASGTGILSGYMYTLGQSMAAKAYQDKTAAA